MQRNQLAIAGLVSLLVVLAGCTSGTTTTDDSEPAQIEAENKKPSNLFYTLGTAGLSCDPVNETEGS